MSNKYTLLTFKGICMNFLLELKFFILSHPVTSKQPHKIVQIHMGHPVGFNTVKAPNITAQMTTIIPRIKKESTNQNSLSENRTKGVC